MTVRLRKRIKRSVRSAIVRAAIRLLSSLPLGAALALGGLVGRMDAQDREAETLRLTAACSGALEAAIRRSPEEWVWMHDRWKTRPPVEVAATQQASTMPKSAELSDA